LLDLVQMKLQHESVGVFEGLLDAKRVAGDLAHELLPGTGEIAQFLYRRGWYKARPDEAVREQFRDPGGVVDVALPPRHVPDLGGVGKHEFESALQDVPNWLPINARRFHGHVRAAVTMEPIRHGA
jgi:hypothetical protein